MQAVEYLCYGPPRVATLGRIAKPKFGAHGVLVRVHAASVNPIDWHYLEGKPYIVRTMSGWGAPKYIRLGTDFAGTVEAVGSQVTRFKPGDQVFGGTLGSFAEYFAIPENRSIALKPSNLTFEQAAAVPVAGETALLAVRDYGKVRAGERVLVNGAGGGVGTFAVQIAKAFGADVTAVTSTANLSLVRSLGADHVIDYAREDFTGGPERYDVIIDCGGGHWLLAYRRVLVPRGRVVLVGTENSGVWIEPVDDLFIKPALMSRLSDRTFISFVGSITAVDLATLRGLIEAGKVKPIIDRRYSLSQTAEALGYLETGHARGKVVIDVP
ncbi:MAG: NAD(P)-dependent alcohol dehydrogenase [Steroidobacteraceae bacterium]